MCRARSLFPIASLIDRSSAADGARGGSGGGATGGSGGSGAPSRCQPPPEGLPSPARRGHHRRYVTPAGGCGCRRRVSPWDSPPCCPRDVLRSPPGTGDQELAGSGAWRGAARLSLPWGWAPPAASPDRHRGGTRSRSQRGTRAASWLPAAAGLWLGDAGGWLRAAGEPRAAPAGGSRGNREGATLRAHTKCSAVNNKASTDDDVSAAVASCSRLEAAAPFYGDRCGETICRFFSFFLFFLEIPKW